VESRAAALKHVERGVEIDLHHNILMRTSRLRPDSRLLLAQARRITDSRFSVLAPIDMTLHAITHLFFGARWTTRCASCATSTI